MIGSHFHRQIFMFPFEHHPSWSRPMVRLRLIRHGGGGREGRTAMMRTMRAGAFLALTALLPVQQAVAQDLSPARSSAARSAPSLVARWAAVAAR